MWGGQVSLLLPIPLDRNHWAPGSGLRLAMLAIRVMVAIVLVAMVVAMVLISV